MYRGSRSAVVVVVLSRGLRSIPRCCQRLATQSALQSWIVSCLTKLLEFLSWLYLLRSNDLHTDRTSSDRTTTTTLKSVVVASPSGFLHKP